MEIRAREAVLISRILYNIYSIDDNQEMRKTFLDLIPNLVQCSKASFYLAAAGEDHFMDRPVGYCMSEQLLESYLAYDKFDYMNSVFVNSVTEVYRESDYFIDEVRNQSPYFKELIEPNDMYYSVQICLSTPETFLGVATLFRGKQGPDFSDRDLFLLRLIKDHLALRLYQDYSANKRKKPDSDIRLYAEYNLTAREIEILQLMLERYSNDEMADYLHVSHFTVQKHVSNIYKKLNVNSKGQLFKLCSEIGQI